MFGRKKREFVRLTVHHLLKYKTSGGKEILSFARNLSAGGLRFYCKEELSQDSLVELTINFPDLPQPLKVNAKIVWVKSLKKIGGCEAGAEFIDIDEDTRKIINNKIGNTFTMGKEDGL